MREELDTVKKKLFDSYATSRETFTGLISNVSKGCSMLFEEQMLPRTVNLEKVHSLMNSSRHLNVDETVK